MKILSQFLTLMLFLSFISNNIHSTEIPISLELGAAYDHFKGIADGSWNDNTGALISAHTGALFFDNFGMQAGGSYGVYDWYGRGGIARSHKGSVQQQAFVTLGAFMKTPCNSGFQAAIALDWMFNKNLGVFALNPSIGQVRLQLGYLFNAYHEFGFWGTYNTNTNHKEAFHIPVSFRAICQANLFWRYFFNNCAETMLWIGVPYRKSLMFSSKRPGQYLIGGAVRVPLNSCLTLEAHGVYMGPTSHHRARRFKYYDANLCVGITYAFDLGCQAFSDLARPYLPLANNSNFLVDTTLTD